jgi:N-acetylneuraminic acid mutarotase
MSLTCLFVAPLALTALGPTSTSDELGARSISVLPRGLTSHAAAELDGWLYVCGGYFGTPHEYCREDQSGSFARLNLRDGATWDQLEDLEPLQSATLVACEGRLVRVGGMRAVNARDEKPSLRSLADAAAFDPRERTWASLPSLPEPRSSHAACALGSRVVVVGGWNLAGSLGRSSQWAEDVLDLDLAAPTPQWRASSAPFRRRAVAAAALGKRVYVIGGMEESGEPSARVDVLDITTGAWSLGPELPETGFGCAAVAVGEQLFASARSGRVWRLGTDASSWQPHRELASPRYFHQLVAAPGLGFAAVGGISGARRARWIEWVSLAPQRTPEIEILTLPAPGLARNRQALFLRDGALHFFGGNQRTGQHAFDDAAFVDEGWKFDLTTLEWSPLPPLPVRRQSLQVAVANDRAWLVVGFARGAEGTRAFGDMFVYEHEQARWTALIDAVRPGRTQFALVERDDGLWIFGGLDYVQGREGGADFHHPVEVLRRSVTAPDGAPFELSDVRMPRARRAFGHAELAGKLYFVGGLADGFVSVPECDVFDFATGRWSEIAQPAIERISPELVALDGALYLAGGSARTGNGADPLPAASIERFDPARGEWTKLLETLPFDPTHLRMFAHRGRLLVVSTHDPVTRTLRLAWIRP